jgi:galactose mutarotase-like enzyme
MTSPVATAVVVENDSVRAEIVPEEGGRARSVVDRAQDRELLYARVGARWDPGDYVVTLAGGWDQMFPNDDPWRGHPAHGDLWSAPTEVASVSETEVVLRCELDCPRVSVSHRYSLLPPTRRGLGLETEVQAHEAVPVSLWATHPMLRVQPGWRIDPGTEAVEADRIEAGRVSPGALDGPAQELALTVPAPSLGRQEVLYAPAAGSARVVSADGSVGTVVEWDAAFFPWLWVVTLTGIEGVDLAVVLEPCTSRPYRLDEAAADGTALELTSGRTYRFWSSVEAA